MSAFALVLSLLSVPAAWAAASLSGSVVTRDGLRAQPVAGAYVQAKTGSPERVVRQVRTDSQGRFVIEDLPIGRMTFGVKAAGYYTTRSGTLDAETITYTCPAAGDCGQVDFTVAQAAVLEGWLTDDFGEPVESAMVLLTPGSSDQAQPVTGLPGRRATHRVTSDDRGYFRIWDIKPGRYTLGADMRMFRFPPWRPQFQLDEREIEITGGDRPQEVRLEAKGDAEVFSISGAIEGLDKDKSKPVSVGFQPLLPANSDHSRMWQMFTMVQEGKFNIGGLKKGEYVAHLVEWRPGGERTMRLLGELKVDRDLADLRLEPIHPTGVRGQVRFAGGESGPLFMMAVPKRARLGLHAQLRIKGPDYTFEHTGLPPGEYRLSLRSPDYYLVKDYSFRVQPGVVTELEVAISTDFAKVRGKVQVVGADQQRSAASHCLVALQGDPGLQTSAADESGAFSFEKVIPGEYRIAAWSDPNTDVSDEQAWDKRRTTVRTIQVESGFETEVDFTVKP